VRAPAPSALFGHKPSCGRCWGLGARVLDFELPVPHAHTRFDEGGLTDDEIRARLADAMEALAEEIRQRERAEVVA
jgi:protein-disulfide isomerase-like protein with CxxC motif